MKSRLPAQVFGLGLVDEELAPARAINRARYGLGAPGLVSSLLPGAIRRATFRSNLTPPVSWTPGAVDAPAADAETAGGPAGSVGLKTLQPALDLELTSGQTLTIAPEGEPTGDYRVGVALAIGAVLVGGSSLVLVGYWLGRRR